MALEETWIKFRRFVPQFPHYHTYRNGKIYLWSRTININTKIKDENNKTLFTYISDHVHMSGDINISKIEVEPITKWIEGEERLQRGTIMHIQSPYKIFFRDRILYIELMVWK